MSRIRRSLLFLWRVLPLPKWIRGRILRFINCKYIVGVLAIITDDDRKVLLFRHTYIKNTPWGLPGGAAKFEDLREALQRELEEESSFLIEVHHLIGIAQFEGKQIDFLFASSIKEGNFKPSDEVDGFSFFSLDELPDIVPRHQIILENLARQTNTWPRFNTDFHGYWISLSETVTH